MEYLDIAIYVGVAMYIKAIILCIWIYSKYSHLAEWLEVHAPMTWETYKRLGLRQSCECDDACRQGRNCKNTR